MALPKSATKLHKCHKSYISDTKLYECQVTVVPYVTQVLQKLQKCHFRLHKFHNEVTKVPLRLFLPHSFLLPIKGKLQKFSVCRQFLQALTFNNQPYCAIYCSIFVGSNTNKRSTVRFKNVRYSQIPRSFHNISISRLMNLFMILIPSVVFSVFHIAHQFHLLLSYWFHDPWRRRFP